MPEPSRIRRALISVYDKTGIVDFARALHDEFGVEIISTGGTARTMSEAGIPVTLVEDITGFPEMLDGRVKTLHPKIHAAILADRDNPEHMKQLAEQGIEPIDMVVVNLYPFEKTIAKPDCTFEEAIEMIDIGGPCLLRAAAKNQKHVLVVWDSDDYEDVIHQLRHGREESLQIMRAMGAFFAIDSTCTLDAAVCKWLSERYYGDGERFERLQMTRLSSQRYGENPHQASHLYLTPDLRSSHPIVCADLPCETKLSFNNFIDASAALELCAELTRTAVGEPRGLKPAAPRPVVDQDEPRASARAAARTQQVTAISSVLREPDRARPSWLLTWTTYGSWLPGDARGFVSRRPTDSGRHIARNVPETAYDADQRELTESARSRMKGQRVELDAAQAATALAAFAETAAAHDIAIVVLSVMPDHVHLLCQAEQDGAKLLQLFKGASARRLSQAHTLEHAPRWWTKSGSKRYIQKGDDLAAAVEYVRGQKKLLSVHTFEDVAPRELRSHRGAARAEARGSSDLRSGCRQSCCIFIKHTNACGSTVNENPVEAYRRAYLGDPNAAMGGILAVNFAVDVDFAEAVMETYQRWGKPLKDAGHPAPPGAFFLEVWVAPSFDEEAVRIIRGEVEGAAQKAWGKRLRLLEVGDMSAEPDPNEMDIKRIAGGLLMQTRDLIGLNENEWKVATKREPTQAEMSDLRLAWLVCKHTKSNAISICKNGMLIGNGAGQMSRVMSCRIATWLAKENGHADALKGSVAASDAFFPFRDGPDMLIEAGVAAIIQPGGSKRDGDTIAACDDRGVAMIFTGTRHFKH